MAKTLDDAFLGAADSGIAEEEAALPTPDKQQQKDPVVLSATPAATLPSTVQA